MKTRTTLAIRTIASSSSTSIRPSIISGTNHIQPQQTRCIRSITKPPIKNRFDRMPGTTTLGASPAAARERRASAMPLRTGVLGRKKGMTAVYNAETGERTPVTIVQMDRVQVIGHKTATKHGYFAVQIGHGQANLNKESRAMLGVYEQAEVAPKDEIVEFMVKDESGLLPVGSIIQPSWFKDGDFVDVKSDCKGKGFAGPMKRHGMKGQPASHGVSLTHRSLGSAGQSQGGGSRVYPGKRMAGRMGGQQVTVQNVKIIQADDINGLLILHGCIAGPNGTTVKVQDARKKAWPDLPGIPADSLVQRTGIREGATSWFNARPSKKQGESNTESGAANLARSTNTKGSAVEAVI